MIPETWHRLEQLNRHRYRFETDDNGTLVDILYYTCNTEFTCVWLMEFQSDA